MPPGGESDSNCGHHKVTHTPLDHGSECFKYNHFINVITNCCSGTFRPLAIMTVGRVKCVRITSYHLPVLNIVLKDRSTWDEIKN